MTTAQQQFVDLTERGQEALAKAIKTWADTAQEYTATLSQASTALPQPQDVLNDVFDFAERLIKAQRDFATTLLAVGAEVTESTRRATETATAAARRAGDEAANGMKATTARVTDRRSSN
jgi:DNA-binding MarR family transcriptional regulator